MDFDSNQKKKYQNNYQNYCHLLGGVVISCQIKFVISRAWILLWLKQIKKLEMFPYFFLLIIKNLKWDCEKHLAVPR